MTDAGGAPHGSLWYLAIYAGISATQILFQFSSTLLLKILSLAAARTMHNNMLKSLLRCVLMLDLAFDTNHHASDRGNMMSQGLNHCCQANVVIVCIIAINVSGKQNRSTKSSQLFY